MKNVVLIGDSIRMSYNEPVKELLKDKALVRGPEENCRFAKYTLWSIKDWIGLGKENEADIIHWNNGIWDTFNISEDFECFTTLDDYIRDMKFILREMKKSKAQIIFATTTPVRRLLKNTNNERISQFNDAIVKVMKEEGIPINDLYSAVIDNVDEYIGDDYLHLSPKGVEVVSSQVAEFIGKYL